MLYWRSILGVTSNFDNDGDLGVLSDKNCRSYVSITPDALQHLCEGFGTAFCCDCPYVEFIPDECLMQAPATDESIPCIMCAHLCPCNRTYKYEDVRADVFRYEAERVNLKIPQV